MMQYIRNSIIIVLLVLNLHNCFAVHDNKQARKAMEHLQVESIAFQEGEMIPTKYTCDGTDISPPFAWSKVPPSTKSFVLICDDPDAPMGTWVHWVVFDIPKKVTEFSEGVNVEKLGALEGVNSWGTSRRGYGGPCPPSGTHRYYFKVYALDVEKLTLRVPAVEHQDGSRVYQGWVLPDVEKVATGVWATKQDVLQAMQGHVLAEGQLMGKYARTKK